MAVWQWWWCVCERWSPSFHVCHVLWWTVWDMVPWWHECWWQHSSWHHKKVFGLSLFLLSTFPGVAACVGDCAGWRCQWKFSVIFTIFEESGYWHLLHVESPASTSKHENVWRHYYKQGVFSWSSGTCCQRSLLAAGYKDLCSPNCLS